MPVEMLYFPRPSIRKEPAICVSFVLRLRLADLIDIAQHAYRAFSFEQPYHLIPVRRLRSNNSDERHIRGPCAARIIHGVADVKQPLTRMLRRDPQQTFGMRLRIFNIARGDNRTKTASTGLASERYVNFNLAAARENRK